MKRWLVGAVIAIVVFVAVYTFIITSKVSPTDCPHQPANMRDACCVNLQRDVAVIACVGNWKFNSTSDKCYYQCEQTAAS